jgi:hypothetical protein
VLYSRGGKILLLPPEKPEMSAGHSYYLSMLSCLCLSASCEVSDGIVVGKVQQATLIGSLYPAAELCELPSLFCGNSHSGAPFNCCPNVRVHRLPCRYGEAPAALIVRVASGRGVG